ncbi:MAG: AsmA family protein [Deferrisomatales bacterium]|nr:AsmA family protein [Deferrisomatales bacterium]
MAEPDLSPGLSRRTRRVRLLRWALLALLGGVLLLGLLLAALPSLLSSDTARQRLEREATRALGRPVQVDTLELAWTGRFLLGGVRVADDPAFATDPLLSLHQLAIQIDPAGLLRQRVKLSLGLTGLDLNLVRDPGGRTNLEALLEPLGAPPPPGPGKPAEHAAAPRESTPELTLPFREVDLTVRVEQVNLRVTDHSQGRTAALRDLSLHLDVHPPEYAIAAEVRGGLWADGDELGPLHLTAAAEHLLAPGGALDPGKALLTAAAEVPGGSLSARGKLGVEPEAGGEPAAGMTATVALDLGKLWAAARPFLPPDLAGSEIEGRLKLDLQGSGDPADAVAFNVGLTGDGLRAGGAILDGRRVGPVDMSVQHRGSYRASRGVLEIDAGRIDLQRGTHLAWRGQVAEVGSPAPQANVEVGPVTLDLAELHRLAQPFLPSDLTLAWRGSDPPRLRLERLAATGPLVADPATDQQLELRGLVLEMPGADLADGATSVELRGARLQLDALSTRLRSGFPADLALKASLDLAALDLAGAEPLTLRNLSLSPLELVARELRPATAGKLPLAGHFELSQHLAAGGVSRGSETAITALRQRLATRAVVSEQGQLQLSVEAFGVQADELHHTTGGAESPVVHLRPGTGEEKSPALDLTLAALRLSAPGSLEPDALRLGEVSLHLGSLEAGAGANRVTMETATLHAAELEAELDGGFPHNLALGLSAAIEGLRLEGPNPVQVARLELPHLAVTARGLTPAAESLFGVAGTFHLDQALRARDLHVPGLAAVDELRQELTLEGALDTGAEARFQIPILAVTLAEARVETPEGPITLPLALGARLDSLVLRGTAPETIDLQGLALHLDAGPLLSLTMDTDAGGLGARSLRAGGAVRVDAGGLSRSLPPAYRSGGAFTGTAALDWSLAGRLPSPAERTALEAPAPGVWAAPLPLPFLDALELRLRLAGVGADLPLGSGDRLTVGGIFTTPELHLQVGPGGESVAFSVPLEVRWLETLPGLPPLIDPLQLHLSARGGLGADGTLDLKQTLAVQPLDIAQEARLTLRGVRRLLAQGLESPPALWLNHLSGDAAASLQVGGNPDLTALVAGTDVGVQGPLRASVGATLERGEEASAWFGFEASHATVALADRLVLERLDGTLRLDKRVRLGILRGESDTNRAPGFLSEEVLAGAGGRRRPPAGPTGTAAQGGGLRIAKVRLGVQPIPLLLDGVQVQLGLPGGLPAVERLQVELLGGTLLGSLACVPADRGYALDGGLAFTGLSTERLVPGAVGSAPEESEVSGQVGFRVPLAEDFSQLLSDLDLQFRLTQVGPQTLGRALYALDPGESNEAILQQRRLVRLGRPLWAAAEVHNGNLSLAGAVEVLGGVLSLPAVERVPVADLPGMLRLEPPAEPIAALNHLLDVLAADRVEIYPDGAVRLIADPEEKVP